MPKTLAISIEMALMCLVFGACSRTSDRQPPPNSNSPIIPASQPVAAQLAARNLPSSNPTSASTETPDEKVRLLIEASWQADVETVRQLIAQEVDVNGQYGKVGDNLRFPDGGYMWGGKLTPLVAISKSYRAKDRSEIASLLIQAGATVNIQCPDGTPLENAVRNKDEKLVLMLLAHGADPNGRGGCWIDAPAHVLHDAIGKPKLVQLLLEHKADPNVTDYQALSPLHRAAEAGDLESAQMLLAHGAKLDEGNPIGVTPLFCAVERKQVALASFLLEKGSNPNVIKRTKGDSSDNNCALHEAADCFKKEEIKPSTELVRLLLQYKADPNVVNSQGDTPLNIACNSNNYDAVKLLLEHGAEANKPNNLGNSPLFNAAGNCRNEVCILLLQHGANPNVSGCDGKISMLQNTIGFPEHPGILRTLLEFKANPNMTAREGGETALHDACEIKAYESAQVLLAYGANPDIIGSNGKTPREMLIADGRADLLHATTQPLSSHPAATIRFGQTTQP